LLHDIGKPATYQPPNPGPGDRIRFNGHSKLASASAEEILARLRFSNEDTAQIVALVKNHMRFGDLLEMRESTRKRFLRLPRFDEHLELHRSMSSLLTATLPFITSPASSAEPTQPRSFALRPLLTGRDLIAAGYRPSPQFKVMLTLAEDAQLEHAATTREEALALVQERFHSSGCSQSGVMTLDQTTSPIVVYCFHNEIPSKSLDVCILTLALAWPSAAPGQSDWHQRARAVADAGAHRQAAQERARGLDRLPEALGKSRCGWTARRLPPS